MVRVMKEFFKHESTVINAPHGILKIIFIYVYEQRQPVCLTTEPCLQLTSAFLKLPVSH